MKPLGGGGSPPSWGRHRPDEIRHRPDLLSLGMSHRDEEEYAKQVVERALHRTLVHWDTDGRQGAVDIRAEDSPTISLEVKQFTSADIRVANNRSRKIDTWHPSTVLTRYWTLSVESSPPPDLNRLIAEAEGLLEQLERHSIEHTRTLPPFDATTDEATRRHLNRTLLRIRQLLGGGAALSNETSQALRPGFFLLIAYELVSTIDPNEFARQVETWLKGEDASNLRAKLSRSTDDQRHAFLYLDSAHPTNLVGSARHVAEQLPTYQIDLPAGITHLWIAHPGVLIWRYDPLIGWVEFRPQ